MSGAAALRAATIIHVSGCYFKKKKRNRYPTLVYYSTKQKACTHQAVKAKLFFVAILNILISRAGSQV